MRIFLLFIVFLGVIPALYGQKNELASIYFDHDKADITAESGQLLDSIARTLKTMPDYEIRINAFTDNSGSKTYNSQLALLRGNNVQQFLSAKGIITEKTTVNGWGESRQQFPNTTEEDRRKNRRVDLDFSIVTIDNAAVFYERISRNKAMVFNIDPSSEQMLNTPGGVIVIIPPQAFVQEDGTLPIGNVEVTLKEALKPGDWITYNLSTSSNGEILQSGGMVSVDAFAGGQKLRLRDDAELTVSIPSVGTADPDMRLFYGEHAPSEGGQPAQVANWVSAGSDARFRSTLRRYSNLRTIDSLLAHRLKVMQVPLAEKPVLGDYSTPLARPKMPVEPKKTRNKMAAPDKEQVNKMFTKNGKMTPKQIRRANEEYSRRWELYQKDSIVYEQIVQSYRAQQYAYEEEKAVYEKKHAEFQAELSKRINAIQAFRDEMFLYVYSATMNRFFKKLTPQIQSKIKFTELNNALRARIYRIAKPAFEKDKDIVRANYLLIQYKIELDAISYKGKNARDKYARSYTNPSCWDNPDCINGRLDDIHRDLGLIAISDSLWAIDKVKFDKIAEENKQSAKMAAYVTETSQLGWINVDKFSKDPAPRIVMEYDEPEAFAMYAYFPKLSSMMKMTKMLDGVFELSGIPSGQQVQLIVLKTEQGKIMMDRKNVVAGQKKAPVFDFKSYSIQEVREVFASL